jgi:hypothetical protein
MGANNFFRGLASGIQQGQQFAMQKQQMELEKQRMEQQANRDSRDAEAHRARMSEIDRDKKMREEVLQAAKGLEPVREVTVVADAEGKWQQPYNDPEEAKRVAEQLGATVGVRYYSGDKDFGGDKDKAEYLVKASEGPYAMSRRIAAVYESYGDSTRAKTALELGQQKVEAKKQELRADAAEATRTRGVGGLLEFANKINDGRMSRGYSVTPDGKYLIDSDYPSLKNKALSEEEIVRMVDGAIGGMDSMVHMYDRQRQNSLEDKKLGLQERGVVVAETGARTDAKRTDGQIANWQDQRYLQEKGLGIQAAQASAQIRQGDQRLEMDSYSPINTGVDEQGRNVVTVMNRRMRPGPDGGVPQGAIVTVPTGVRPAQKPPSAMDQLLLGVGGVPGAGTPRTPGINPAANDGFDWGQLPPKRSPTGPYKQ